MKKRIFGMVLAMTSALFAQEEVAMAPIQEVIGQPAQEITAEQTVSAHSPVASLSTVTFSPSFTYLKLAAGDSYSTSQEQVVPGVGLGYRWNMGLAALDMSASYTSGKVLNNGRDSEFYTLPKVAYLLYLSPKATRSFYAGPGLAWGSITTKEADKFVGVIPSASLGYEMQRKSTFRSFIQLDVSQAVSRFAYSQEGNLPKPVFELALGGGF